MTAAAAALAAEELKRNLEDPMWRISNLYKIIIKGDREEDEGREDLVIQFKPNRAQRRFIKALWYRNIILKARQLGFTTLICILWLDHALFTPNVRCGIIAHDRDSAEIIFRDKVKFAYENLPPALLEKFPLKNDNASELRFAHNNSSIRVATSMRSGTIHRLLVSEFGKICAKYPDRAAEVVTGSLPAVPKNGIAVIESTAEGREGEFYDMTMRAKAGHDAGKRLSTLDYRFHFFPWWQEPEYRIDPSTVAVSAEEHAYFDELEPKIGRALSPEQRAWYINMRDSTYSSNPERMWQEFPSTPEEAFQQSTEGCYYTKQIANARKEGRIGRVPYNPAYPVNTFWDIGQNDETAIWFHQKVGAANHFIGYYEKSGEAYSHFVRYILNQPYVYGTHYLPHDADHKRQGKDENKTAEELLQELGLRKTVIVDRTPEIIVGINQTRDAFSTCLFDEVGCKEGLIHLELYRKEWDSRGACWKDNPKHDVHSNGADAFRQFGQVAAELRTTLAGGKPKKKPQRARSWKTM